MNAPMSKAELRSHLESIDPGFTALIDDLRSEFPGLKLVHLKTEQVEIGTPTDPARLCEMTVSPPIKPVMEQWYADAALAQDMHKRQRGFKVKPKARKK